MKPLRLSLINSLKCYSTKSYPQPILNPKMPNRKLFINNEWVDSLEDNKFTPINPTNGKVITEVQSAGKQDLDRAVEAAKKAFHPSSPWRKMNASDRGRLLLKLAALIERDASYLASLETLEVGKLYTATVTKDILAAYTQLQSIAGYADKMYGQVIPTDGDTIVYTRNEPVGVCALIVAWNFQVYMNQIKLFSCLTPGNVAILKPSQHACLATMHMAELTKEAGFPPGVISVVPGTRDVGRHMSEHPDIDLISLTGSTQAGQDVYKRGADGIKRLVLELGGKSAIVICDDVDLDLAVQNANTAIFHNAGQCCCSASRCYVQDTIYEEFVKRSKELTSKRKIGDPFDPSVLHGPQANEPHLNSILQMVEKGKSEGAAIEIGGNRLDRPGFFMEPAILTNVHDEMFVSKEEIFGPVQIISPFKTMDEVIERVNNSDYGLASSIFTNDVNKINHFSQQVRAGSVWVNCYFRISFQAPFGGYKKSGLHREGGQSGIKIFTEEKAIHIKTAHKIS